MLVSRNDILYRAMEILREPLFRHFDEQLKRYGRPDWFNKLTTKPKDPDDRPVIPDFYDKRDIYVLLKAIQYYWTTIEKNKILDRASIGSANYLEDVRNDIAHPTGLIKYDTALRSFREIKHLIAQLDDKKASAEIDELVSAHETVSHIAIRSGVFCRACGEEHAKHGDKECPPMHRSGENRDNIRKFCEKCGEECKCEQRLAWVSSCPKCDTDK